MSDSEWVNEQRRENEEADAINDLTRAREREACLLGALRGTVEAINAWNVARALLAEYP